MKNKFWLQTGLLLTVLLILTVLLPQQPLDPWNLISLQKISFIMFALAFIQTMGSLLMHYFGSGTGSILSGFLGGLISSTVTTANLAKSSKVSLDPLVSSEVLVFLAATAAMLFEGLFLIWVGSDEHNLRPSLVLMGPILMCLVLIFFKIKIKGDLSPSRKAIKEKVDIIPLIQLSAFIIGILSLSKILQKFFGFEALLVLTFLISLFEVHGSIIANVQLYNNASISTEDFNHLLALSVLASYSSKLFLVFSLGSQNLKKETAKITVYLLSILLVSWLVSLSF